VLSPGYSREGRVQADCYGVMGSLRLVARWVSGSSVTAESVISP
jgi:hypothetical protein